VTTKAIKLNREALYSNASCCLNEWVTMAFMITKVPPEITTELKLNSLGARKGKSNFE